MRRSRKYLEQRQSDNHARWLVSYADFITLLFAFFVVMYAISSVSEGKYRAISESLTSAFGSKIAHPANEPAAAPSGMPQRRKSGEQTAKRRETMRIVARDISKVLEEMVRDGQVRVTQSNRGIAVEINAAVLFSSGQAQLQADSVRALTEVSRILSVTGHTIQVEGYTDNAAIGNALFPSNWELSAARAASVVRLFIENGVAEQRLSVIGYGPNRAASSNETAEGRARNRRVTVMILDEIPGTVTDIPIAESVAFRPGSALLRGPAD